MSNSNVVKFPDGIGPGIVPNSDELSKEATRFSNLRSGGRELALQFEEYLFADTVVLGIALGGVPVAHEVANYLRAQLDLVIIRRLLVPQGPESQVCAVNIGGSLVLDEELLPLPAALDTPLDYYVADAIAELGRRVQICRSGRSPIEVAGKTVMLVDCGIHTGLTMRAAIAALRTKQPAQVIAAVPVAAPEGHKAIVNLVDKLVCLAQPEPFGHVGLWYEDFSRPNDDGVGELLKPAPRAERGM